MALDRAGTRIAGAMLAIASAGFFVDDSRAQSRIELAQATSPEVAFWESVRDSDDPAEIEAYLKSYPDGQFAALARIRLEKLKSSSKGASQGSAVQVPQPTAPSVGAAFEAITLRAILAENPNSKRAMLGVAVAALSPPLAHAFALPDATGAFVTALVPDSPAQSAGIKPLDVVVTVDGGEIVKMAELPQRVGTMSPGAEISVAIRRLPADIAARLRERAEKNDAEAAFALAWLLESGAGTEKNEAEAARWYREAADDGLGEAAFRLGAMYATGRGVSQDQSEAIKFYRQGADKNDGNALNALAVAYESGAGIAKDEAEAARLYRKGADQGDPNAMYQFARMLINGRGIANDDAEAVIWLRKAADAGNADAITALGVMYEQGRGVFNDDGEAVRLYRQAAELNNAWGLHSLGWMYGNGRGVAKDDAEAFRLYSQAAALGNADSMYQLGRAYHGGLGVGKDTGLAADWIYKALQARNAFTVTEMTSNGEAWGKEFRRELQRRMQKDGVYSGKLDGSFGPGTMKAIEAFAPPQ